MADRDIIVGLDVEGSVIAMAAQDRLRHGLVTGTSGWGKSGFVLSQILGLLRVQWNLRVVVIDPKGDLGPTLADTFLPVLAQRPDSDLTPRDLVRIAPFSNFGVALNPLTRVKDVPVEVQAYGVAALVEKLLGSSGLGPRMRGIMEQLARAFILAGGNLAELTRALTDEPFRLRVAGHVSDPEVRRYLVEVFDDEPSGSKDALRARMEHLLLLPKVRAMLCADACITGPELLETGITLIDVGGADQGFAEIGRFIGGLLYSRVTAAVFSRPAYRDWPVLIAVDEAHECVKAAEDDLERMLTQARFKNVACWLITQGIGQLPATILPTIRTNVVWSAAFRPDKADIAHVEGLLPVTGRRTDPLRPDRVLTRADEKKALLEELAKLPPRHALFADTASGTAEVIRSATLPYARMASKVAALPVAVREAWRRGAEGVPFDELRARTVPVDPPARAGAPASPSSAPSPIPMAGRARTAVGARRKLVLP